jgi:DNA-binding NarL/FixJ family response regulator
VSRVSHSRDAVGSAAPSRQIRVLHVDDDPALLDLTADFLERLDGEITLLSETDPRAVPERLETEAIDCVISDKRMPECDGLELCRRVREAHPDLPFVLFTSERGDDVIDRTMEVGATGFVAKEPGVEQYERLADRVREAVLSYRQDHHDEFPVGWGPGSTA